MDRAVLEQRLRVAKVHVALDREHVGDLRKMVRELEETPGDAREANRLLKNCLKLEASDVAEVERLMAELAKAGSSQPAKAGP
jgi:hypothetical protein